MSKVDKNSKAQRQKWADPEYRRKQSEAIKKGHLKAKQKRLEK
jgi:hypothetical protein